MSLSHKSTFHIKHKVFSRALVAQHVFVLLVIMFLVKRIYPCISSLLYL